jgi:hypothetical protein
MSPAAQKFQVLILCSLLDSLASMTHGGHKPRRYPAVQQSLMMRLDVEPTVCDARKMVQ